MKVKYDGISFLATSLEEKDKITRPVSDRLTKSWKHGNIYEEGKDFNLIKSANGSYFGHPEEEEKSVLSEPLYTEADMISFAEYCGEIGFFTSEGFEGWIDRSNHEESATKDLFYLWSKTRIPTQLPITNKD